MIPKTLRVRARAGALVPHYERHEARVNSFVGRRVTTTPGEDGDQYPMTGETAEVPFRAEYIKALRDGDLEPADETTAKVAGLDFGALRSTESARTGGES